MNAPDLKYTDRDLRENNDLYIDVYDYLMKYTGEFQFLVDAKMMYELNNALPVGVARGVLNCMRVDPRVASTLPKPMPPQSGTVTPIKRKRHKYGGQAACGQVGTIEHGYHNWELDEWQYSCEGWHRINRKYPSYMPVKIKYPYMWVCAKGGKLVHTVDPQAQQYFEWTPEGGHEWGWFGERWTEAPQPRLNVKLICKYPSIIRDAQLVDLNLGMLPGRKMCPHCTKEIEARNRGGK